MSKYQVKVGLHIIAGVLYRAGDTFEHADSHFAERRDVAGFIVKLADLAPKSEPKSAPAGDVKPAGDGVPAGALTGAPAGDGAPTGAPTGAPAGSPAGDGKPAQKKSGKRKAKAAPTQVTTQTGGELI